MCTAISFFSNNHYFGRNLDLEFHYDEAVTITPRNYPFRFRATESSVNHPAIIGIATIIDGYPLYYDATNEHGLSVAALNFPGNAKYNQISEKCVNVSAFELIPYLLCNFKSVQHLKEELSNINILNIPFNNNLPLTPLHWIVADKFSAITVEQTSSGLQIYDNPAKVLTNNPPFPFHMQNLTNYINLTSYEPQNRFSSSIELIPYSRGMGALGLPGDASSASRFVRAAFVLHNSIVNETDDPLSQFFHILASVEQQKGCIRFGEMLEKTVYTSCCDTDRCIYYYTTYENQQITGIKMYDHDICGKALISYPLRFRQNIYWEEN